jgi:NAD-dependent dihydropyrimidine dehydrogenase PreA subunit
MKYLRNIATLEFFKDRCTGCGRCVEVCPHRVFTMNQKEVIIADRDRCIECGACVMNCQFDALQVQTGVGCAQALINSMIYGGEPVCDCGDSAPGCCG